LNVVVRALSTKINHIRRADFARFAIFCYLTAKSTKLLQGPIHQVFSHFSWLFRLWRYISVEYNLIDSFILYFDGIPTFQGTYMEQEGKVRIKLEEPEEAQPWEVIHRRTQLLERTLQEQKRNLEALCEKEEKQVEKQQKKRRRILPKRVKPSPRYLNLSVPTDIPVIGITPLFLGYYK